MKFQQTTTTTAADVIKAGMGCLFRILFSIGLTIGIFLALRGCNAV